MGRVLSAALLCGALGGALAMPARAQMESREGIVLQNQILELRRDLQYLQQQRGAPPPAYYGGQSQGQSQGGGQGGGGSGLEAQLLDRVQALEDQVRRLRGQLDEQSNTLRRAQDDLAKQIQDMNFRLQNGGGAPGSAPSAPPRSGSSAQVDAPPVTTPRRTPELAMQEGNAALARRDYPIAEAAAREVLSAGRNSPRAGDANFLLGQALMGQRNYQGAAVAYDDAYNRSRTGTRAPDALLGLANALTGLSERPAACATLDKLRKEFPSARGAVRQTSDALRSRNGCG